MSEIDTSKMSKGKADALEAAESARDKGKKGTKSFSGGLFTGEANYDLIYPFPKQKEEDKAKEFGIRGYPTIVAEKNGERNTYESRVNADNIQKWVNNL